MSLADAVGRGRPNADIAAELHMSVGTVKSYISRILTKTGLEQSIHDIGEEVHSQYILTFSPLPGQPGLFHKITVQVKGRPDLKVKTREGYWAIQ